MVLEVARDTSSEPSKSPKAIATENKAARERLITEMNSKYIKYSKPIQVPNATYFERDVAEV